jgi:nitrogen-specific signal transduction histidine kinase
MSGPRLAHVVRSSIELAQLRADVLRTQKLAAIGTLAGGIAHEFNNILQIILGHSQHALTREEPERWKKALNYCHDAAEKGARIVRQLLTFARKRSTGRTRFGLARVVALAVQADEEAARRDRVTVHVEIRSTPLISGDSAQITQVILNLLTNARHACTAMVTSRAQLDPRVDVILDDEAGMVRVIVSDNGVGIQPEDMDRVFEPFFTTKGSLGGRIYDGKSSGTGLGLAISSSIVQGHDGRIDVRSTPGEGSTFTLLLPLASADSASPRQAARKTQALDRSLHGKRVLIVDDEELLADLLSQYLEEKGLVVDVAGDAGNAMEKLRAADYDLLLFDLTLPGTTGGLDLLKQCRAMGGPNAAAPAFAMTGHAPEAGDEKLFDAGFRGIVRKPFEVRELGRLVADSLRVSAK